MRYVEHAPGQRPSSLTMLRTVTPRRMLSTPGIEHYDMYFPDGHNPPDEILERFLDVARKTDGTNALPPVVTASLVPHSNLPHPITSRNLWPHARRAGGALQGRPGAHGNTHLCVYNAVPRLYRRRGHRLRAHLPARLRRWATADVSGQVWRDRTASILATLPHLRLGGFPADVPDWQHGAVPARTIAVAQPDVVAELGCRHGRRAPAAQDARRPQHHRADHGRIAVGARPPLRPRVQ